jgi:hypothetical protein
MVRRRKKKASWKSWLGLGFLIFLVFATLFNSSQKSKKSESHQTKKIFLKKYSLTPEQLRDIRLDKEWQVAIIPKKSWQTSTLTVQDNVAYVDAGYVTPGLDVLRHPSEKFPVRSPVTIKTYKQVGPKRWGPTNRILPLPDKTKITIEGGVGDVEWWNVNLVKVHCADCNNPETYVIHKDGLVERDYWNCSSFSSWTDALKYGQVVTRLSNSNAEVITAGWDSGKWIDPATFDHSRIFCLSEYETQFMKSRNHAGKVVCYTYKFTNSGSEYNATVYFNPDDLMCIGQF